jgi:hypothetical protein
MTCSPTVIDSLVGLTVYQTQRLNDKNGIRSVVRRPLVNHSITVKETTCDEAMLSRIRREMMRNCVGSFQMTERRNIDMDVSYG